MAQGLAALQTCGPRGCRVLVDRRVAGQSAAICVRLPAEAFRSGLRSSSLSASVRGITTAFTGRSDVATLDGGGSRPGADGSELRGHLQSLPDGVRAAG